MPTLYDTYCGRDRFHRSLTLTTTPSGDKFGWTKKITESTAQTTFATTSAGLVVTLGAANESKVATVYQNDILSFLMTKLLRVNFTVKVSGIDANTTLVFGVASGQADTVDNVTRNAWFKIDGSASTSAVVVETDDNVTDNDDKSTGKTLSTTLKKCTIDFTKGSSDIRFFVDGDPVATAQTFSMASLASTDGCQLFVQLQKASGTGTASVTIRDVSYEYQVADG